MRKPHMAFEKVVGGTEIYNFRIQSFMHFYTKFWSFSILNQGSATHLDPNAVMLRSRASPRAARSAREPAGLGVRATHRTRPHAGRGMPLPHVPCPEAHWSPPSRAHTMDRAVPARCVPRSAGLSAAPAVHAPVEAAVPRSHLQGHALVSASELPYLNRAPFPSSRRHHCLSCRLHRRRRTRLPVHPPVHPILLEPPLDPVGPIRVACSPSRALAVTRTEVSWLPPPAIAVRPLRQLLRPNFGHPQALGEHVVTPHSLPGRKRRWLAGIWLAPPPFHARGLNCKALVYLGCFL
jgi:hypothetical protein